ncbi:hypothetical protein [Pseudoalteromonas sp. ZZD1]
MSSKSDGFRAAGLTFHVGNGFSRDCFKTYFTTENTEAALQREEKRRAAE